MRRLHPACGPICGRLYARLSTRELLHIGAHVLVVTLTPPSYACAQVNNAHGWHGARGLRLARAIERQKQQQKQKQQQQQQQKKQKQQQQQKQQKQKQIQKQTSEPRVSSLSPDVDPGAVSVNAVEARVYPPFAHHTPFAGYHPRHAPRRRRRAVRLAVAKPAKAEEAEEACFVGAARFSVSKQVWVLGGCFGSGVEGPITATPAMYLNLLGDGLPNDPIPNPNPIPRRGNSLTSTSNRFDSKLNRMAAGMGSKGGEVGSKGDEVFGQTVQARVYPHPTHPRNQ
eukprot:scaffold103705_cov62-Phaeocystis_antarctica.AAC.2